MAEEDAREAALAEVFPLAEIPPLAEVPPLADEHAVTASPRTADAASAVLALRFFMGSPRVKSSSGYLLSA